MLAGQTEQGSSEPSDAADNEIQFCGLLDEKKRRKKGGVVTTVPKRVIRRWEGMF